MELLIILAFLALIAAPIVGFVFGYKVFAAKTENKAGRIVLSFLCAIGSLCLVMAVLFGACLCAVNNYH